MPTKLVARGALWRLLATAFLIQFTVPLARVATTYRAISIDLTPETVGFLAAAFAALPVLFVVFFGRMTDRFGVRPGILAGAGIVLFAVVLLFVLPPSLPGLLVGMSLLGLGQTLHYSGLQMVVNIVAGKRHRDGALGNYLLAMSLGDAIAPLLIGLGGTDAPAGIAEHLYCASIASGLVLCLVAFSLTRSIPRERLGRSAPPSLVSILRTPGMITILIAGSICATCQDLMTTYLPVMGVERAIEPFLIGLMMTTISLSAVASRATYGTLSRRIGRYRLAIGATLMSAIGLCILAIPLPPLAYFAALPLIGFGLGSAGTATVAIVMQISPTGARGTAMALRQMASRIGLFAMPFAAGAAALVAGLPGIFGLIALSSATASRLANHSRRSAGM
jgi:MFS family permease